EDGIRDDLVTGVQTCALPIYFFSIPRIFATCAVLAACCFSVLASSSGPPGITSWPEPAILGAISGSDATATTSAPSRSRRARGRSEERRVGKEGGSRGERGQA